MFLEIDFKSDLPIYEQIRRGIIIGLMVPPKSCTSIFLPTNI